MTWTISPETTLQALLEAFPDLENEIQELVPALAQFKNPVLRKTFLSTATLEQVARIAGRSAADIVLKLREAAGQGEVGGSGGEGTDREPEVVERIDADAMLAAGVHPVGRVRQACSHLAPGEAVEMSVGFRPAPLIDLMQREGFKVTCESAPRGGYIVRFSKA
jgi:hypothetical protein